MKLGKKSGSRKKFKNTHGKLLSNAQITLGKQLI